MFVCVYNIYIYILSTFNCNKSTEILDLRVLTKKKKKVIKKKNKTEKAYLRIKIKEKNRQTNKSTRYPAVGKNGFSDDICEREKEREKSWMEEENVEVRRIKCYNNAIIIAHVDNFEPLFSDNTIVPQRSNFTPFDWLEVE